MPTDEPPSSKPKPSRTGFAIALTLNILVIVAILIGIPIEKSAHLEIAIPLMAFSYQMGALGVIAFCCGIGDLITNRRHGNRQGMTLAGIGLVLAFLPQPLGSALIHTVAHFLGWHLDF